MRDIPPAVLANLRHRETVLFIGSGFSLAAGLPSARSIATRLARTLRQDGKAVPAGVEHQLDQAAELFQLTYGRGRLVTEVESFLRRLPGDEIGSSHRLVASLVAHGFVKTIITTNYDTLIEDACARMGAHLHVVAHESQLHGAAGDVPVLYKIHGDFSHPELLVLTPADFQGWQHRPDVQPLVTQLRALLARSALLFLGYSLSDFNILALLLGAAPATQGAPRHKRFAAVYEADRIADVAARLGQYGVEAFPCQDTEALLRGLLLALPVALRVTHVVFNYPSWYPDQQARYGGIETFIDYLKTHAHECEHTTIAAYSTDMLRFTPDRVWFTSSPTYPASFFFFRAAAKAAVERLLHGEGPDRPRTPDVVHMHFLAFAPLCEEAGLPTLCTSHSLLSRDLAFTRGVFDGTATEGGRQEVHAVEAAERAAASAARFVTVVSAAHEEEVRGLGARSIQRLDAPFDPHQFRVEDDPATARERNRVGDSDCFTITFIGRPDRRKGVEILIDACERLARRGVGRLQLLLVGYGFHQSPGRITMGPGRYWIDTSAMEQLGVRIIRRDAANAGTAGGYYAASDIVVVPSLYEPMGYVVLEAMACGRPIVAARVGGITETIVHDRNGLLFEAGNAEALAEQLFLLHGDAALRERLGRQARLDIEARRPVADVVQDWQRLYRHAAFAFGESLYPDADLLDRVRSSCERINVPGSSVDLYVAAMRGCGVVSELTAGGQLPAGVPLDLALVRAVAFELHRALRRNGYSVPFSANALTDVMSDLSLALLNSDRSGPDGFRLSAEETRARMAIPPSTRP